MNAVELSTQAAGSASTGSSNTERPPAIDERAFRADLLAIIPSLRAFARGLSGNRDLADDLAQEALAKAWSARASYTPGTNFRAWIFRILRNHFYTTATVARRFTTYDPEAAERLLTTPATQDGGLMVEDLQRGLLTLPAEQREALLLLESGLQWNEIADISGVPLGTIKSRITRGRGALKRYMDGSDASDRPETRPG